MTSSSTMTLPSSGFSDKNRILSPRQVEHLILTGNAIVIYDGHVLKLNSWLIPHPGGDIAIFHMIGRDATDEMNLYHCDETVSLFKKYSIGKINYPWVNMLPPIQGGVYRTLLDDENEEIEKIPLIGQQPVHITPKIPQGVIPSLEKPELFKTCDNIRDPKLIIDNFDNNLVRLDLENLPSLDYETQRNLSNKYNELHQKVIDGGYYDCPYVEYFKEILRIGSTFLWSLIFLKLKYHIISAMFMGFTWQQLVFIAHDAGHISITHNYNADNIIGMIIASWCGGLSLGWWKRNHNVHHLVSNDPIHDPDIQHLPFFAVSSRLFGDIFSTYYQKTLWFDLIAKAVIPFQRYTYYPILAFGRFNLYRLSLVHLILGLGPKKGQLAWFRYFELAGLSFFTYWFFYLIVSKTLTSWQQRTVYILVSHVAAMLVHVQITLSHFAMSTSDLGTSETFCSRQIRTTMDVDCPEWFDYFHGGLQFQTIHHLFPRLPRHNLRKVQNLVIEFCNDVGLHYTIYGFATGNDVVLNKMNDVGKQVRIFKDCLQSMKSELVDGANIYEKKVQLLMKETL